MRVQVLVRLKPGVLDVQGKAVEKSLLGLGFPDVSAVRVGRLIEFDLEGKEFSSAKEQAEKMCKELLANPIIENFEIRAA